MTDETSVPIVSPRTALEFGIPANGASAGEAPVSIDMAAGNIPQREVLARLGRCNGRVGVPDRGDTPVAYRYLTLEGLAAPSVVDTCMGDQQIKHEGKAQ